MPHTCTWQPHGTMVSVWQIGHKQGYRSMPAHTYHKASSLHGIYWFGVPSQHSILGMAAGNISPCRSTLISFMQFAQEDCECSGATVSSSGVSSSTISPALMRRVVYKPRPLRAWVRTSRDIDSNSPKRRLTVCSYKCGVGLV